MVINKIRGPQEPVELGSRLEILAAKHPEFVEQNAEMWGHDTQPTDAELTEFESVRAQIQARKSEIMAGMWAEHAKITAAVEAAPIK
jgi:hypothetical protein